ncbi:hypothetical protein LTS18_009997, partial [Coniosporium uncinatum]
MDLDRSVLNDQCTQIRQTLKEWEKSFALAHDGRKAGRDDIKADALIAAKYKEYNKTRDLLSGKAESQTISKPSGKRKSTDDVCRTPSKRRTPPPSSPQKPTDAAATPTFATPSSNRTIASPFHRPTMIGPTPQKDGQVLGLFDLLPVETPSKRQPLGVIHGNVLMTPSKNHEDTAGVSSAEKTKFSRTPISIGKRFLLDSFVTPQKRRKIAEEGTPSSTAKRIAAPAFLRRDTAPLAALLEEAESPEQVRPRKKRGLVRSLSSMIQGMRKLEEEKYDEDEEALREMEEEAAGIVPAIKPAKPAKVLVEDSQAAMALGPDGAGLSDEEDLGEEGKQQPTRVWKKKGLKRQTKRTNMRPVQMQARPTLSENVGDEADFADEATVAETQASKDPATNSDNDADTDAEPHGDDSDASEPSAREKKKKVAKLKEADAKPTKEKKPRKISATAHANYRALKIKNKNSKGKSN